MTRLGFQIPNFTLPGTDDADLFERVSGMARAAEDAGFDTVFVMDHFYQLPMLGRPEDNMLEAYTLLGGIAARTERVRLGTLVSGNTYRNPALLAKIVTTLDIVSRGRALLGIGAGWFEQEHRGYGFEFPPLKERLDRLEEALQIIVPMLRGERPSVDGRFYRTRDAINVPGSLQAGGPKIMIGGGGEKRTLRLVAQYADESNLPCAPADIPRKLEALDGHCRDLGRERSEIVVSWLGSVLIGRTQEDAEKGLRAFLGRRGIDFDKLPDEMREGVQRSVVLGDADTVGERIQ
ncbi:MAG: LLM class F420-dependent oxidoreductase, partial [Proteobacteria bacterium]|nr:LLM class F420-dependent oxidoreductase [Pseudomonadota bacterium]